MEISRVQNKFLPGFPEASHPLAKHGFKAPSFNFNGESCGNVLTSVYGSPL